MTGVAAAGIIARPVDIVSGQKFLSGDDELDFVLPSRLPVRWQRYWRSGNPGDSVLGADGACSGKAAWSLIRTAWCGAHRPAITSPSRRSERDALLLRKRKNWLEHHQDDSWSVYDVSGERWHYAPLRDDAPSLLQRLSEPCGNDILFEWNADNTLHALTDSAPARGLPLRPRQARWRLAG